VVALGTLCVAYDPRYTGLVSRESRDWFSRVLFASGQGLAAFALRFGMFRRAAEERADKVVPGILLHYALRKRAIADAVGQAIEKGARQMVVFGAGLDPIGLRTVEERRIPVWEVDCSSTQEAKRSLAKGTAIRFLDIDLGDGCIVDKLATRGWQPGEPTVFIAEGVFMYLPKEVVERLLSAFASPTNSFVFTLMELSPEGVPNFRAAEGLTTWLEEVGEPFTFGLHPRDVPECLEEHGWRILDVVEADDLRERYLPGCIAPKAVGEYVVVASGA
jgi:methyltransferase (TIGR00027 family)